jgi:signal transduction histidine kinase
LQGSLLVPVALPTALAFLLLAASLQLVLAQRLLPVSLHPAGEEMRPFYVLLLIFLLLVGGIVTAGFVSFRHHEQEHRLAMEQKMTAIALLKAEQISAWLREYQNHGEELAANPGFAARVEQWLKYGDWVERDIVSRRLEDHRAAYHFCGTMVLDARGRTVFTLGESLAGDVELAALVERARVNGRVVRSELFRGVDGKICLAWVIPIFSPGDGQLVAYIARHLSADIFLFPFLANWPGISRSAETLLVRRDGEDALYLNNLKFNPAAPLSLRVPLSRPEVPGVQAALGRRGITTGPDYRGVPVLAAVAAVPGTSWQVVARIDLQEVYAPLRGRLGVIVLAVLLLLLGAGGAVALLWRRQQQDHRFALLALAAARDRQLNLELERRVAERTTQLEEVNRELEAFSYAVSHDLKAPLRGIKGYSRLLEQDCQAHLNEEGRLFVNSIRQGVEGMEKLIDDLLTYSRLERRRIRKQKLDLAALVQMVLAEFRAELAEIGAELRTDVPSVPVRLDPDGLGMALRNLVANAIKFSSAARPPRLTVSAQLTARDILFKVEDNGIGFEMKFADQIFEIFTRLGRTDDFPGSGVGLALVRKAVQRMGGRVWAESSPGRGAAFFIEIPRSPVDMDGAEQRSSDD